MDITLNLTEDAEVFFEMTGFHCCVSIKDETIYFDFTDQLEHLSESIQISTENLGIYLKRYKSYMTIYDLVLYCMVHEPLHCLVSKLKPRKDYCPFFDIQNTVDNHFLDDAIMDNLGIKLFKG